MRRIGIALVTMVILGGGLATAQEAPPTPTKPKPRTTSPGKVGRFVLYPAQSPGELEYLVDSTIGDVWVISRDPSTNYVYLGFIPKGPRFTFQDIFRQKRPTGVVPTP